MPRKIVEGVPSDGVRRVEYSQEKLIEVAEQVRVRSLEIRSMAKKLKKVGVESVMIDGDRMLYRGLDQITDFIANASDSVVRATKKTKKNG